MSQHALHGPSALARRAACPGSGRLEAQCPERTNEDAEEGTDLHDLLRRLLADDETVHAEMSLLDADDERAIDFCAGIYSEKLCAMDQPDVYLEHKLPGITADSWGTCDAILVDPLAGEAVVFDWKFGRQPVEPIGKNVQIQAYTYMVSAAFGVEVVHAIIVRPRANWKDEATFAGGYLRDIALSIRQLVAAANAPDAPLHPGEHCRYCRAAESCPALRASMQQIVAPAGGVDALTVTELGDLLTRIETIKPLISAAKERAYKLCLASGGTISDSAGATWGLRPGRATRRWVGNPVPDLQKLADAAGKSHSDLYSVELKSPAQIEATFGKSKAVKAAMAGNVESKPGNLQLDIIERSES